MIYRKTKARNVLAEFREYVRPAAAPKSFVDDILLPMSDAFTDIRKASYDGEHRNRINELLTYLGRIDNADWIPPAILYMKLKHSAPDDLLQFLTDLERLAAGLMIRRTYVNHRIERYGRVLAAIEKETDLYEENSPLQLTTDERTDIVEKLNGDIYNAIPSRPILLRLDEALSDGSASYEYATVTVEHVLPQNPAAESEWFTLFPEDEQQTRLVHKLGNLVLLSRRKNAKARNYDFEQKKWKYFAGHDGTCSFVLTTQVLQHETWTPQVVLARQDMLIRKLKEIWRL